VLLTDFLPPVASQGQQGSCAAWSSAYYCYTYAVSQRRGLSADRIAANEELRFSPAFLYHQGNGGQDRGMPISRAFQILHEYGCASLVEMPYSESDFTSPPDQAAIDRAARFKARDTGLLFRLGEADPERLKTYLAEARQPFVMAIPILVDFPQTPVAPDFVYRPTVSLTPQTVRGLHAVTVVGYDDAHHAFRIVNSWGPRWGDHGFLWIDEDFVRAVGLDGYAVAAGGILSRDPSGRVRIAKDISLTPPGTAD